MEKKDLKEQVVIKAEAKSKKTVGSKEYFLEILKKATQQEPFDKKKSK